MSIGRTNEFDIETAFTACVVCALWSSLVSDESGERCEPADDHYGLEDIDADILEELRDDLAAFVADNRDDLAGMDSAQVGHDFWLTREGHGAGFWDRGLGERGDRLTAAAKIYGEFDLGLWIR